MNCVSVFSASRVKKKFDSRDYQLFKLDGFVVQSNAFTWLI